MAWQPQQQPARGRAVPAKFLGRFQLPETCRVWQCLQGFKTPLIIVIIPRAMVDPFHQLHSGHLPTVGHRPVTTREDERAPLGWVRRTSPDGMCSCLQRYPSLLRRWSQWSLRRPSWFMLNWPQKFKSWHRWRTRQVPTRWQATTRPQVMARPQVTTRPQVTARPQGKARPQGTARPQGMARSQGTAWPQLTTRPVTTQGMSR